MSRLQTLRVQLLIQGHVNRLQKMIERLPEDHPAVMKQSKRLSQLMLGSV